MPAQPANPARRPAAPAGRQTAQPSARNVPAPPAPQAQPPRQVAYDPGYAALGGHVPVIVQARPSWARPGSVTAAGVLGIVLGAFAVISAIRWFAERDVNDALGLGAGPEETMARALLNLALASAFIIGAIGTLSRQSWGRWLLVGAAGAEIVYGVFNLINEGAYSAIMFLFMAIPAITLLMLPASSQFFATKDPLAANRATQAY